MIEFREAQPGDADALATAMRAADYREFAGLGLPVAPLIEDQFAASLWARVVLVDGAYAAAYGIHDGAGIIAERAPVWALTTPVIEQHRVRFMRESYAFVQFANGLYPVIEACCDVTYAASLRWLRRLGFVPVGEEWKVTATGARYQRAERRAAWA